MNRKHNVNEINLEIRTIDFWSPHRDNNGGMRIYWSSDIGFGTLDIIKVYNGDDEGDEEKEMVLNTYTEGMDSKDDKAFTTKILSLIAGFMQIRD